MKICAVCGTRFDHLRFQVVLPGCAESFDRVDCAAQPGGAYAAAQASGNGERSDVRMEPPIQEVAATGKR